jgi:hypothetical protein
MRRPALAIAVLALLAASHAHATPAPLHAPIHAIRLDAPINVDGILNEPVWRTPNPITEFYQAYPDQGQPASERTEVRVAYDAEAIYVGARCYDAHPDSMIARLSRRDVSVPSDRFSVYLDPYHDKRSGYYFLINCAGVQFDGTLRNDGDEDSSWDGVWNAHVHCDSLGWTAEFRIPLSQLRFQNASPMVWGINFRRVIMRRNEEAFLAYQPRDMSGFVSRWPDLVDLDGIRASRSIELLPYLTSKGEFLNHADGDPFHDGAKYEPDGGFDLRTAVGSRMTLNATINPDFGQVEVDPATVNLSDVETFYEEKRPFFVDGASNFRFGSEGASNYWGFNWSNPTFFYSRRVGRAPEGTVPNADYADIPIGTTILGAAKLTGKITPTTNFGTMHALTGRERADLAFAGGPTWRSDVEPLTYYGVTRALHEFSGRKRGVGSMVSLVQRRFDDDALKSQLNGTSALGALDGWLSFGKDRLWVLSGWAGATYVRGTEERITALQEDPRHYFQRPDATHLGVDTTATSLGGYGARLWLNKERGKWFSNSAVGFISPGFELNDIGFQSRADVVNAHAGFGRRWSTPTKHRQYGEILGALFGSADFGGNVTWSGLWTSTYIEFRNHFLINTWHTYNPPSVGVRTTRGGPRVKNPAGFEIGSYIQTNSTKKLYYWLNDDLYAREDGGYDFSVNPAVEWKPVSSVRLSVGPNYSKTIEHLQYVETVADPSMTATYGNRYVFATLDQTTVSADVRLTWSFTPNLSLQTYIQPYISAGSYTGFKALAEPNTRDFVPSSATSDPNFNFKSLRGNAVFRWEYMPGSALYLVWTQQRQTIDDDGTFKLGSNFNALARAPMDNIFLAKVTYYFVF